jgi:hypothetical protein
MSRVSAKLARSVALRAGRCCEYCQLPDGECVFGFQPDHIIAVKHGGPTNLENLAWTCFYCNSYKGACMAGYDLETGRLTRLYNPRRDVGSQHFKWKGGRILGRTAVGRTTAAVLNLNHPDSVIIREHLIAEGVMRTG